MARPKTAGEAARAQARRQATLVWMERGRPLAVPHLVVAVGGGWWLHSWRNTLGPSLCRFRSDLVACSGAFGLGCVTVGLIHRFGSSHRLAPNLSPLLSPPPSSLQ